MDKFLLIIKNDVFVQGLGLVGMAMSIYGIQHKEYQKVVFFRILNELIFGFQFLLLGAYTGMATNFAAVLTNTVYSQRIKHKRSTLPFQIIFGIMFVTIGFFTWHGPISVLVICAKLLSTVSFGINNTKVIRIINLIITPMWIVYDIFVFSIGGIIADVVLLISIITAIIRIDILKK